VLGSIIDERYRVTSRLGRGAQAAVFLVEDRRDGTQRAMKVLSHELAAQPEMAKRFRREFAAAARLDHPNVVRLGEAGVLPDGCPYYTMEYLPHPDLAVVIDGEAPFPEERVRVIMRGLAAGVAAIHEAGIVHRDLKPANVILAPGDRPVIVDFGLARDLDRTPMTATGMALGTPRYMAPEMLQGLPAERASDIYALGVMAYVMVCGVHPFEADDMVTLMDKVLAGPEATAPSTVRVGISAGWDGFTARCMARNPELRFESAETVAAAVAELGNGRVAGGVAGAVVDTHRARAVGNDDGGRRPSTPRWPALVLLVVAGVIGVLLVLRDGRAGEPRDFDVVGLHVRAEPGAVVLTWRSERAYGTRVVVAGDGPSAAGAAAAATTAHRVVVAPLDDGRTCTLHIVFPDGSRSLPIGATVPRATIEDFSATVAAGRATLSWRRTWGDEAWLAVDGGRGAALVTPAVAGEDGRWTVRAPGEAAVAGARGGWCRLGWRDGRTRLVPGLRAWALNGGRPLARCEPGEFVSDLLTRMGRALAAEVEGAGKPGDMLALTSEEHRDATRRLSGERLAAMARESGLSADFAGLTAAAPLLFECRAVTPSFDERHELYRRCMKMLMLSLYSYASKTEPRFLLEPLPELGDFALRCSSARPGGAHAWAGGAGDSGDGRLLLARYAEPTPLAPPRFGLVGLAPSTIEFVAHLDEEPAEGRRFELELRLRCFRNFILRLSVNEEFAFLLWDDPYLPHVDDRYVTLVQRLPAQVLRKGRNRFSLRAEQIFHGTTENDTALAEAWLVAPE